MDRSHPRARPQGCTHRNLGDYIAQGKLGHVIFHGTPLALERILSQRLLPGGPSGSRQDIHLATSLPPGFLSGAAAARHFPAPSSVQRTSGLRSGSSAILALDTRSVVQELGDRGGLWLSRNRVLLASQKITRASFQRAVDLETGLDLRSSACFN